MLTVSARIRSSSACVSLDPRRTNSVGTQRPPMSIVGQHLQLALDHEAKADPVRAADDHVGQRVVDDARVANQHQHGPRPGELEVLDLEVQVEQRADARQVAPEPAALESKHAVASTRAVTAAGDDPDAEQSDQPV